MLTLSPSRITNQSHGSCSVIEFQTVRVEHRRANQAIRAWANQKSRQHIFVKKPELDIKSFKTFGCCRPPNLQ